MVKRVRRELRIDITEDEINRRIDQIETLDIDNDLRAFMLEAMDALISLDKIVGMKETTILRLRKIFNKKMEKMPGQPKKDDPNSPHPRGNNNGKNGKEDYPTAPRILHTHESLKAGVLCPECGKGSLSKYEPGIYIRITGSAPLKATVHETEKFRCNACLEIFEANFEGKKAPK